MPLPPSPLLIAGWRTTTPFTRIPGWATAHPANTSCCLNPPPVRFNGVNSTLSEAVRLLANDDLLPRRYFDHGLSGEWKDFRDCHIRPDLILIYRKPDAESLELVRLGSHSELGF